jgi:hypothetical protein
MDNMAFLQLSGDDIIKHGVETGSISASPEPQPWDRWPWQ